MKERHNRGPQPRPSSDAATLRRHFVALRRSIGITRKLTLHDLRRTTAVAMYRYTRNIRSVQALLGHRNMQSTIWYLDHDLEPVAVDTLETIKKPFIIHRSEKEA
jgi:integrase